MAGYKVVEVTRLRFWTLIRRSQVKAIDSLRQQLKPTTTVTYWYLAWMLMFSATRMFVAVSPGQGGKIIGVALLVSNPVLGGRRDSLEEIVVDPLERGQGVGKALAIRVALESQARGARDISLMVAHDNPAAQSLYDDLDFERLNDRSMMRRTFRALS